MKTHNLVAIVGTLIALTLTMGLGAQSSTTEPRRFAIVVGVNQYADSGIVQLQKAVSDAQDLGALLQRVGGYRVVTIMTTSLAFTDANFPSKNKILDRVQGLVDLVRPSDQVVVFFSGHGVNDPRTGDSYLVPADGQARDLVGSSVNLQRDILAKFEAKGVNNVVAFVDACQSTISVDKGLTVVGIDQVRGARSVVISATSPGKVSYEDPRGPNGLFTRSLMVGLAGEADGNRDGQVGVAELAQWLPDHVSEYAFSVGKSQQPTVFNAAAGATQPALVRVAVAPVTPSPGPGPVTPVTPTANTTPAPTTRGQFVTMSFPEGLRGSLVVYDQGGREIARYADTLSETIRLEAGSYRVEVQDSLRQYYPLTQNFTVANARVTVPLTLRPNFGSLEIRVTGVEGADVLINGRREGATSNNVFKMDRLKSGTYDLVISKDLYETRTQTVVVEDGKANVVSLAMTPNFFTLEIPAVVGQTASLWIDGTNRGNLPQTLRLPFRETPIRVVPADNRYREWTENLRPATKGETIKRTASLAGRQGSLEIITSPSVNARITLTPVGVSGATAQSIGTAPLDYDTLIGDYDVQATATIGGVPYAGTSRVTVREGQLASVRLQLQDASPTTGTVTATTRANGTLSGAGKSWTINAAGTWTINDLPRGSQTLTMTYGDGKTESVSVNIPGGASVVAAFSYSPPTAPAHTTTPASGQRETAGAFTNSIGMSFVVIPAGTMQLGSGVSVTLSAYRMATTEVTQGQYQRIMGSNPSVFKSGNDAPNRPVEQVSWYDALVFCNKLSIAEGLTPAYSIGGNTDPSRWGSVPTSGNATWDAVQWNRNVNGYRLPTEAEWEYAARGGHQSPTLTATYAGSNTIDEVAWYTSNSGRTTKPVATKKANNLGLYDMSGNVWEWNWDWYGRTQASGSNPDGPSSGTDRVLRGGSWGLYARFATVSYRFLSYPYERRLYGSGFRLVRVTGQ